MARFVRIPLLALLGATCVALLSGSPRAAHASLIGDQVGCEFLGPGVFECDSATATVIDPGAEFVVGTSFETAVSVDINANSIALAVLPPAVTVNFGLGSIQFTDLDPGGVITDVILTVNGTTSELEQADVTFDDHTVTLDLVFQDWQAGTTVTLTLVTAQAVPAPSTVLLLAAAFAGLGLARVGSRR